MQFYSKTNKRTRQTKKTKRNKTKRNFKQRRGGGGNTEIDVRQIMITEPIINAIKEYNPDADLSQFRTSKRSHGFGLTRMEEMMQSNFDELLQKEPVELDTARNDKGQPAGVKIDGVNKKAYEIRNGRHRIARAIIENRKTINADIKT